MQPSARGLSQGYGCAGSQRSVQDARQPGCTLRQRRRLARGERPELPGRPAAVQHQPLRLLLQASRAYVLCWLSHLVLHCNACLLRPCLLHAPHSREPSWDSRSHQLSAVSKVSLQDRGRMAHLLPAGPLVPMKGMLKHASKLGSACAGSCSSLGTCCAMVSTPWKPQSSQMSAQSLPRAAAVSSCPSSHPRSTPMVCCRLHMRSNVLQSSCPVLEPLVSQCS